VKFGKRDQKRGENPYRGIAGPLAWVAGVLNHGLTNPRLCNDSKSPTKSQVQGERVLPKWVFCPHPLFNLGCGFAPHRREKKKMWLLGGTTANKGVVAEGEA